MDRKSFEIYKMTEEREKVLWGDSIFVFDTSALLDFYFYPIETSVEIFEQIFEVYKSKFWIPAHVEFEYLKNRESQITKPIKEKYHDLKELRIKSLGELKSKMVNTIDSLKKETSKPNSHPFLPQEEIEAYSEKLKQFEVETEEFIKGIKTLIENKEKEILTLKDHDIILDAFEKYLIVGESSSFQDIIELAKEGELRYKYKIPPGYLDLNDKEGTQIFGDLIVWKQILDFAKDNSLNVIFICNDLKFDWCYKDKRNRILRPREELIKEFFDHTGKEFWMYNQSQFLYKANEQLKTKIETDKIEEISKVIADRNKMDLIFECGNCGMENYQDFDNVFLDFELTDKVEVDDGAGDTVKVFQAFQETKCQYCRGPIDINYLVGQNEDGSEYVSDISTNNATITSEPDFSNRFLEGYYEYPDEPEIDLDLIRNR